MVEIKTPKGHLRFQIGPISPLPENRSSVREKILFFLLVGNPNSPKRREVDALREMFLEY
jgi:hypothetical protein